MMIQIGDSVRVKSSRYGGKYYEFVGTFVKERISDIDVRGNSFCYVQYPTDVFEKLKDVMVAPLLSNPVGWYRSSLEKANSSKELV